MAFTLASPLPTPRPHRSSLASRSIRAHCSSGASVDPAPPPESRVARFFPAATRHLAPHISFSVAPDFPLVNTIGLIMQPPPLDLAAAAAIRETYAPAALQDYGAFAALFAKEPTDPAAATAADRYFPPSRRYEVPVIDISYAAGPDGEPTKDSSVTVARGQAFVDPDLTDDAPVAEPDSATATVDKYFPGRKRNVAPVIEFAAGENGVSVSMGKMYGGPDPENFEAAFPDATRFMAPVISMKAPKGEWDTSGFVEVAMEEMQLDLRK